MLFTWLFICSLILSPLYVWRFSLLGSVPANFLLVIQTILFATFFLWLLWTKQIKSFLLEIKNTDKFLLISCLIFWFVSVIGLFNFGFSTAKFGQELVLFSFPITTLFALKYLIQKYSIDSKILAYIFLGFILVNGLLAIIQYFSLWSLPVIYWGNSAEPKRAVSFFAHPNGYGLFVVPLLVFVIPWLYDNFLKTKNIWLWVMWMIGFLGILLSLSRGALLGLFAALGVFVLVKGGKKLWIAFASAVVVMVIVISAVPNLRYRVMLPFMGEKSSVARFSLWHTGEKVIIDHPLIGLGVNGFADNWNKYNSDSGLQHYNYPHNIILNFWVDYGLVGVSGFVALILYGLYFSYKNKTKAFALGFGLFLVSMIVHGLIDIPYLKNDLALQFWILYAIALSVL